MIDSEKIALYISDPGAIISNDLDDIASLAEKHPYSSLFSLLYLKGLKINKSLSFEEKLKEHSYRISDRVKLFELINTEEQPKRSDETTVEKANHDQNTQETEVFEIEKKEITLDEVLDETKEIEEDLAEESESEPTTKEEATEIELSAETAQTITDITFEFGSEATSDESMDKDIEEISDDIEIKEIDGLEYVSVPETKSASKKEPAIESDEIDEPIDEIDEIITQHLITSGYHLKPLSEEEEKRLEEEKPSDDKLEKVEITISQPKEKQISEDGSFISWLHADVNYQPDESDLKKELDEFDPLEDLSGEVQKPKAEFFSPSKKAKESLKEETIPVSETLAKVFVLQGNYPKAIEVYEELCLKFPEKKTFFADSIKEIKKKLNIK